jgi:hypothetical protein
MVYGTVGIYKHLLSNIIQACHVINIEHSQVDQTSYCSIIFHPMLFRTLEINKVFANFQMQCQLTI